MRKTRDTIMLAGMAVWVFWIGFWLSLDPMHTLDPTISILWIVGGIFTLLLCILAAICQRSVF